MDLSHAVRKFEEYLDHYDRDDDKNTFKINAYIWRRGVQQKDCFKTWASGKRMWSWRRS